MRRSFQSLWFVFALAAALLVTLAFARSLDWAAEGRLGERAILVDWCLVLPLIYGAVLWHSHPFRAVALRVMAASCAGLWLARWIVPDGSHDLIARYDWVRFVGMAVALAVEGAVLWAVLRQLAAPRPDPAALARHGVPPLLARVMIAEARFWRWLWRKIRR